MVEKVFWKDPYLSELDTRIASVSGDQVTLEETIFFAFSGGQESDFGSIHGRSVRNAEKQGQQIVYTLDSATGLNKGDPVKALIDWPRRYRLMRLHFAIEIILDLIYKSHPGTTKTGAHIGADKARIDFVWEGNISDLFPDIQEKLDQIINADLPIHCQFTDPGTQQRSWKIDGFSEVPCGGPHVRSTAEIGSVALKQKNPGKGRERIEIYIHDLNY